jgi:hypothetical protein
MEKRINTILEKYLVQFKDDIKKKVGELGFEEKSKTNELLEFVYEYQRMTLSKDDFSKRKRVQNSIPVSNRCIAVKSNNERCTRRRKEDCEFCGTHFKNGVNEDNTTNINQSIKKLEVTAREIDGIVYYVDEYENIYRTEDILNSIENPKIIGRYKIMNCNRYMISEFV